MSNHRRYERGCLRRQRAVRWSCRRPGAAAAAAAAAAASNSSSEDVVAEQTEKRSEGEEGVLFELSRAEPSAVLSLSAMHRASASQSATSHAASPRRPGPVPFAQSAYQIGPHP